MSKNLNMLIVVVAMVLVGLFATQTTAIIPITSIQYDANMYQVGVLFNENRLLTFKSKDLVKSFFHNDKITNFLTNPSTCHFFDKETKTIITPSTTLFDAFVHHNPELRCDKISYEMKYIIDPAVSFTEQTIDRLRRDYLNTVDEMKPYPMTKGDIVSLSIDTLIGWVKAFLEYHWGPIHPFPTWPTDGETLKAGKEDIGLYHFSGKRLTFAESQQLALNSINAKKEDQEKVGRDVPTLFGVTADWGAGTEEAQLISHLIKSMNPEYTINMGDLYLVGSPDDARKNALGIRYANDTFEKAVTWFPGTLGTFWIQGNHEMYSRGWGYFDSILPKMGFINEKSGKLQGQTTSYQLMENNHWRILFLDTGYTTYSPLIHNDDNTFVQEVIDWLTKVVKLNNPADKRGVVILTHHNFMSAFSDRMAPGPAQQLKELLQNRVVLTMWGHEHKTAIYGKSTLGGGINAYPRCMGTGGFPVDQSPIPPTAHDSKLVAYDNREYVKIPGTLGDKPCGYNGFYTMNFTADRLRINYFTNQWKDASKTKLDWDVAHITMTEEFTYDANGDMIQTDFMVLDKDITVVDKINDVEELNHSYHKHGTKNYLRQNHMGDLEDQGLDMNTYYEENKDKRFTQPVGQAAHYTEDGTKAALKEYILRSLEGRMTNDLANLSPEELSSLVMKFKSEDLKNKMKPRKMTVGDIKSVKIDYQETVNIDGHKMPKIQF